MNSKNLVITAIICGMSFLGMNVTSAAVAYNLQTTQIETEQLNQKVRDRNTAIAAVAGIAAIAAIANHNDKHHKDRHDRYDRGRHHYQEHHRPSPPRHYRR